MRLAVRWRAIGTTDCNSYKKSTVMSLTGWGTPIIHCFTHLYSFGRSGRSGSFNFCGVGARSGPNNAIASYEYFCS
ncbi:hypothetical protein QUB63_20460 [Microcoleus sp. ARI1-B5]|uniref:hypothetical protein n=1 Tax=unclassified Microcoleus TaxID=2642155 RepID=UPI002FD464C3